MTRGYGRAHRTRRVRCAVPRNWGRNQTLICAVQATGPFAPLVVEGAVNGPIFEWYVQEVLCPALTPGQVVVMDNLAPHKHPRVRAWLSRHPRWVFHFTRMAQVPAARQLSKDAEVASAANTGCSSAAKGS